MPKFYAVEVKTYAIVQVDDDADSQAAWETSFDCKHEIVNDTDLDHVVVGEITNQKQLSRYGWDARCLPYGGDGEQRLEVLLPKE